MAGEHRAERAALGRAERCLPGGRHPSREPPEDAGELRAEMASHEGYPEHTGLHPLCGTLADHKAGLQRIF